MFKGSVKAPEFGSFMVQLITKNQKIKRDVDKYVFFIDNASIHKAETVEEFF